jgi:hypothetical protein
MSDLPRLIAHEGDVLFDVFDVFDVLFEGVGVVEAKVTFAFGHFCLHEVETHGFGMADVQVPVGLRGETG